MKNSAAPSENAKAAAARERPSTDKLEASLEFATGLIRSMQDGFTVLDPKGVILDVNPAFCHMTGFSRTELIGHSPPYPYWPPEEYPRLQAALTETAEGSDTNFELIFMRRDGQRFQAFVSPFAVKNKAGDIISYSATVKDITARKTTEEALRIANQKLRLHFEQTPMAVIEWDLDFRVTRWNPAAETIFGYRKEEAVGRHASFMIPEASRPLVAQIWQGLTSKFGGERSTNENVCQDGRIILCEWYNTPLIDENGAFTGAASVVQDITDRNRAEQALATTSELLERTGEMAKVGGWSLDLATKEHNWSLATCRILEVDPPVAPALEQGINFFPPEARPVIQEAMRAAIEHETPYDLELPAITAKGRSIWVRAQGHAVMADGKAIKLVGALHDITEHRRAELLLAWEKEALETISSVAPLHEVLNSLMIGLEKQVPGALCSVLLLDDDGIHLRHGAAPSLPEAYYRAIHGIAIGPAAGSCGTAAYSRRQVIVADIESDPIWDEYRTLASPHNLRACWSSPIEGNEGKILGTFAIYHREPGHPTPAELEVIGRAVNITRIAIERKQSESALRDSEEKFHTLFELASDAILITQGELFMECNARTLEMFGCQSRDQILGHPPYEFSPPVQPNGRDSTEMAIEKINAAYNSQPQFFEWMHKKLDGTPFPAEVNISKVEVGGRAFLQAVVRDISERKHAEEMIRQQNAELESRVEQRTAELSKANEELRGHMVTRRQLEKEILEISEREQKRIGQDLHDDLGQQLAGIWCLSQLLESSLVAQKSPEAASAAKIASQLKESLELTHKLAKGLYPVALQAEGLSSALDELAQRTAEIFKVKCRSKCPQKLDLDYATATHLYRIAQEAITNATKHGRAQNIEIELSSNSRHTLLTVNNDGIPMAKKPTNGGGMGLRIMKYRADMIGGSFSIKSNNENEGTSVTCMIPTPKK